jgi:hypothetical protein
MDKKKDKSKLAKSWKALKKAMRKAAKGEKVGPVDVPLVSPPAATDLI